jgi:hypothetical protein
MTGIIFLYLIELVSDQPGKVMGDAFYFFFILAFNHNTAQ